MADDDQNTDDQNVNDQNTTDDGTTGTNTTDGDQTPTISPEELASLKESIAKLEAKNRELAEEKSKAKQAAEKAAMEQAKKDGDLEALEKSWQQKLEASQSELTAKLEEYERMMVNITSGSEATRLANELAMPGHAELLLPHVKSRLTTEVRDGQPTTRVLDADGNPSAMTVDDLKKEIMQNKVYAPILAGSKANGAGSAGKSDGGQGHQKSWDEMTDQERVELRREDPQRYKEVVDAFYGRA